MGSCLDGFAALGGFVSSEGPASGVDDAASAGVDADSLAAFAGLDLVGREDSVRRDWRVEPKSSAVVGRLRSIC
jgi:hypothetical protein